MKRIGMTVLLALAVVAGPARATVTFEYLFSGGYPLSITPDGQTIAGNTTSYGAFRWTQATGLVGLGQDPTVSPGGAPRVSADGNRVAATIISADSTYTTAGLWTLGSGWQRIMPPGPPDLTIQDRSMATVYGLSGDGSTVVGLFCRNDGRAHAFRWTQAGGAVDLGSQVANNACRPNNVNYDGSVIFGWDEYWRGNWRPAAWYNGVETVLDDSLSDGQCNASNPAGTIVVGFSQDQITHTRELARWTRSGSTWSATQRLGTQPGYGINIGNGVTADGNMIVGYTSFDGSPYSPAGFVWTAATGIEDVNTWLGDHGVAVDPGFYIFGLQGITPDGQWIIGYGRDLVTPYTTRGFRIHNTEIAGVTAPASGPGSGLALAAPAPNPSAGATALSFTLPVAGAADLSIFDASGRRVASIAHLAMAAGPHTMMWNGRDEAGQPVANGMYWARLQTAQGSVSRRIVRVR
jgi:uncharacterized membrane protein